MSTTKDLLSQSEIDSLLDIFTSPAEETGTDILFEVRMAKVAKAIENYLENLGLAFDEVKTVKSASVHTDSVVYDPDYQYLERVSIDNGLALTVLAARFGAKNRELSIDRTLSSLEKRLLDDVCIELVYIVEKELDGYLQKDDAVEKIADYGVVILDGNSERTISFTFKQKRVMESVTVSLREEESLDEADVTGTKIEAVLGTIAIKVLKPGVIYKVHSFAKNRALLLIDNTLPFMANRLDESDGNLLLLLQEAVTDKRMFSGYYLCIAGTVIDDEALLSLERGTFLELRMYDDAEIYKDGKMVAKAKLLLKSGEIAVKVLEG